MSNAHDHIVIPPRPPLPASTSLHTAAATRTVTARLLRDPRAWLLAYGIALTAIALWPSRVDLGARGFLRAVSDAFPLLTYARLEFGANVALFVPLGLLLTLIITRDRWLVLPIAILTTVVIECIQAVALAARVPSILDIIANTAGACLGMLLAVFIETQGRSRAQLNEIARS